MPQNPEESCALAQSEQQAAQPAFRIGGVYRQKNGDVVKLLGDGVSLPEGCAWAKEACADGVIGIGNGLRNLRTGEDTINFKGGERDLTPGELVQINGQWMSASQSIAFPSGAIVKTQGDKITGRVEPPAETKRAPLPYFTERTPFDPHRGAFSDWSYTFCTEGQDAGPLHPLQKENDGAVLCGSAHLLAD